MPTRRIHLASAAIALTSMLALSPPARAWTKSNGTHTTDGSQSDVTDAANHASPGDVVLIPAGTFTWGATPTAAPRATSPSR